MSAPVCTVMVGLPASGKSTRVTEMCKIDPEVFVYSTDNYIESVASAQGKTYNEAFADTIKEATENMENFLQYAIEDGLDIIWDQTNLSVKKRRSIIERMKRAGYAVDCECFVKPEIEDEIVEWNRRLHARVGKTIPEHIITNMVRTYVMPTVDEGFERVKYWNIYGNILGIDYGVMNE